MTYQPAGPRPCRVGSALVIDDHPLYGAALAAALGQVFAGCKVRTATTLGQALDALREGFAPDLVVLDLKLPDVTGLSGFLRLRDEAPEVPVLVNSAITTPDVIDMVMEAGAAGFVPKDVSIGVLTEALCAVRSGQSYLPVAARRGSEPGKVAALRDAARRIADLTPQQSRIMKLICEGKPNKLIAYELSLAEATVKAHITAILRRLGVQNRTQAAMMMESASFGAEGAPEGPASVSGAGNAA